MFTSIFHGTQCDCISAWGGIKVMLVELKNINLPQEMQRAIAAQAEAERERRAKMIAADGEFQTAQRLAEAASRRSLRPACAGTC